jgi:hypothetical protein
MVNKPFTVANDAINSQSQYWFPPAALIFSAVISRLYRCFTRGLEHGRDFDPAALPASANGHAGGSARFALSKGEEFSQREEPCRAIKRRSTITASS